jgi:hypothetical protein
MCQVKWRVQVDFEYLLHRLLQVEDTYGKTSAYTYALQLW